MNIVVYCSSFNELPQEIRDYAVAVGHWIGDKGHTLVYGGVNAGLMHVTAQAVKESGGHVTGVIPALFEHRADPLCDQLLLTGDLNERKSRMIALGDAFVVLPGGLGTIDEWVSTLSQLTVSQSYNKPVVVCDHEGMYGPLIEQLRATASSLYAAGRHQPVARYVHSPEELKEILNKLTTK